MIDSIDSTVGIIRTTGTCRSIRSIISEKKVQTRLEGMSYLGEHTDYNDGFVLPTAIERCTVIAADRTLEVATAICNGYCMQTGVNATAIATPPAQGARLHSVDVS